MWQEILSALITAVGSALVGFLIFGIKKFTTWLSTKTSDAKLKAILSGASSVTEMVVEEVYQTYVESLKGKNAFDKEAQEKALVMAKEKVMTLLSTDVKDFLKSTYGDLETWVVSKIEATIYERKNQGSTE
jgi:hypothetical protein